jgi:L-amino acid N-acyltransferase YncA
MEQSILIETILSEYPKELTLKDGLKCAVRPLQADDEMAFHEFFLTVPVQERMFIKHRVTEPAVIHDWCQNIDYGRNLPLLALDEGRILADATLHQQLGGWKRHIGRVSVLVQPQARGRGLASALVSDLIEIARRAGLERLEAEFIGEQEAAMKVFGLLGFAKLAHLPDYVKDMQAVRHDWILMGLDLKTDEEYAGMG